MDARFADIVRAAVRQSRSRNGLLWADALAERIVSATPLKVEKSDIAEQLTMEAMRTGAAVVMAGSTAGQPDVCS